MSIESKIIDRLKRFTEKLAVIRERIKACTDLKENWDSYGAKPISPDSASLAIFVGEAIAAMHVPIPVSVVVPVASGALLPAALRLFNLSLALHFGH